MDLHLQGQAPHQSLQLGDGGLLLAALLFGLEHQWCLLQEGGFPSREQLGLEVMLAADLGSALGAGDHFQHDFGFELGRKGSTCQDRALLSWTIIYPKCYF